MNACFLTSDPNTGKLLVAHFIIEQKDLDPDMIDHASLVTINDEWEPREIAQGCISCRKDFEYELVVMTHCKHFICKTCFSAAISFVRHICQLSCPCDAYNVDMRSWKIVMANTDRAIESCDPELKLALQELDKMKCQRCPLCTMPHDQDPVDGHNSCPNLDHNLCLECWSKTFRTHCLPYKDVCVVCCSKEQVADSEDRYRDLMSGWTRCSPIKSCVFCQKNTDRYSCCNYHSCHFSCGLKTIFAYFRNNKDLLEDLKKALRSNGFISGRPDSQQPNNLCLICLFSQVTVELRKYNCMNIFN